MKIEFLEANPANFERSRSSSIEWIVMHYTAASRDDKAKNNALYFKNNVLESSAHYFVDDDEIYQSVKDEDTAYHCGAHQYVHPICRNNNSIGVEMCGHHKGDEIYASKETLFNAAKLVSELCNKYKIPLDHVIRHYDVTGKLCPIYWIDNNGLDEFRQLVSSIDKVSVITCTYNNAKYLGETIDSVLKQTYTNFEYIIIDDGSSDNTKELVNNYKDSRIKYIYQDNQGSSAARNLGIKIASGRYIAFLDSDDIWNNNFLDSQLSFLIDNNASCVCSGYEIIDEDSKSININIYPKELINEKDMETIDHVGNLTGLYDTSEYGKIYFNEELSSLLDDYFFWYEISKLTTIYGNQEVLAKYRLLSKSSSSNKLKTIPKHFILFNKYMKQSYLKTIKSMIVWGIYGIKKYIKISIQKSNNKKG